MLQEKTGFEQEVENALKALRLGGVILYPTDTIWGLGCDATNESAVDKVYQIKHRPVNNSMIVLVATQRELLEYVAAPAAGVWDIVEPAEEPLTVIYPGGMGLAPQLLDEEGNGAIRVVEDEFCFHLIKRLRYPLVST